MPDQPKSGPGPATMALIVVLALPVVLVLVFLLVGKVQASQDASLPALETKGLKWAQARATSAGFGKLTSYDSLGRDRGQRDAQAWQVCFVTPDPGSHARSTLIEFGVVRLEETCPAKDQGRIDPAGQTMPNLYNRTAYMARVAFGDDASIRIVDVVSKNEVTRGLGDYRICTQEPAAGQPWDGVPVKLAVVPFDDDCAHPGSSKDASIDPGAILDEVLNKLS
jgi:hypothetical protein